MNRRGFTLIELLAVIVIIGVLGVLIVPGLLNNIDTVKESSYNTLIKNIVTSAQLYYEESEYGDLSKTNKYGIYACNTDEIKRDDYICFMDKTNNTITTTLGALANTGFLKVNNTKELEDGTELKLVINPINDKDISDCTIEITKEVNSTTYKVTYRIENTSSDNICPQTYE